jgi:hypothetical protein
LSCSSSEERHWQPTSSGRVSRLHDRGFLSKRKRGRTTRWEEERENRFNLTSYNSNLIGGLLLDDPFDRILYDSRSFEK